jgi:hypothetical protein
VATAVDSVSPREELLTTASPSHISILEAWHLLSLDAPTVAALWSWFFARAMRIDLPWHAPLLLALGTWLVYAADRVFDGLRAKPIAPLRQRHLFHARHRKTFAAAAIAVGAGLIWLIVARMTPAARYEDTVLFLIALAYLSIVHKPGTKPSAWLPKELAVGLVFAAATAVPAWSRLQSGRATLLPAIAIFAALCWLNCVAIERWENLAPNGNLQSPDAHATTRWTAEHFRLTACSLAAISAILCDVEFLRSPPPNSSSTSAIYLSAAFTAMCFAVIDRRRARFSPIGLRIAADAVLLTPIFLLPFVC